MAQEELDIEISPSGKVTVRAIGIKGHRCVDVAEVFVRIIGREASRELTSEYYEVEGETRDQINLRQHR